MPHRARRLLLASLLLCFTCRLAHADARFDLVGPRIDVRVTRAGQTLPIAAVPNLLPGDRLWIHPDLPPSQSVNYLLICVFLRGVTNPPPDAWFTRIETWNRKVREEGAFITVPADAQQALLFLAPETGGDFTTLRSAVQGRPGAFVRASQDLIEAGFEEARIEKYVASIRRVPPSDPAELQRQLRLVNNLGHAAYYRHPESWSWSFNHAAARADEATDLPRAQALVREGRRLVESGRTEGLRSIVEQLWRLLPAEEQTRRLGHESGVR